MFPTGSRLLIGATLLTAALATIYGVTNGGSLGTTGLISAAAGEDRRDRHPGGHHGVSPKLTRWTAGAVYRLLIVATPPVTLFQ